MNHQKILQIVNTITPLVVKEIDKVLSRPYWKGINVGEAFESLYAGYSTEKEFENLPLCQDKKNPTVVDIHYYCVPSNVQIKTCTGQSKPYIKLCRCTKDAVKGGVDACIDEAIAKWKKSFKDNKCNRFYMIYHDFITKTTTVYLLATVNENGRIVFHGNFLDGSRGSLSKDYLVIPRIGLEVVGEPIVW